MCSPMSSRGLPRVFPGSSRCLARVLFGCFLEEFQFLNKYFFIRSCGTHNIYTYIWYSTMGLDTIWEYLVWLSEYGVLGMWVWGTGYVGMGYWVFGFTG